MGRLLLAFKTFFSILGSAELAERVRAIESGPHPPKEPARLPVEEKPAPLKPMKPPVPSRSDALSLLETLQREARFLDFIQEEISGYTDQQVGAAVREVHRGCQGVLTRMFALEPVIPGEEGSSFTVSPGEAAARIHLVGNVSESRPVTGILVHAGWQATKVELPHWTGDIAHQRILAPAEVEVK